MADWGMGKKWNRILSIATGIVWLILIVYWIYPDSSTTPQEATSTDEATGTETVIHREPREKTLARGAWIAAKFFVEDNLKAPASAKFPLLPGGGCAVWNTDDETFHVRGYVDAENSYGAKVRQYYVASMRVKDVNEEHPNNPSDWNLLKLSFE